MTKTLPSATLVQLRSADWDRLWLQCLVWARSEARRYSGLPRMEREIVQTAIEKTFSGERTWSPEVCDLPHHLRMTIRSLLNSAFRKFLTRELHAADEKALPRIGLGAAETQERLDELRHLISLLRAADPDLATFFLTASRLLLEQCDTEGEVAAEMGLSPSQFSKKKARIRAIVAADAARETASKGMKA